MKLGVNGWRIHGRRTGVGRYLFNIVSRWERIEPFDAATFYSPEAIPADVLQMPSKVLTRVLRSKWPMLVWENLLLGPSCLDDVLFCPSYSRPLFTRARTVVTTHDAVQQIYPEMFPLPVRVFYNRLYGWSARHATLVITDSEAGREDIVRYWGVSREKIRVIYLAPAEFVKPLNRVDACRHATAITENDQPFFLFVGKISGRRNLPCLLEAFGAFKRESGQPHSLVLAGLNLRNLDLNALCERFGVRECVRYCDYLEDNQINVLYNAAEALVMPSVYETVSLPVMEAQAAGTPVICIDTGGMREVTGGAAVYVRTLEPRLLADAMTQVACNESLRDRLRADGLRNATRFSWERCAKETLAVLAEAVTR